MIEAPPPPPPTASKHLPHPRTSTRSPDIAKALIDNVSAATLLPINPPPPPVAKAPSQPTPPPPPAAKPGFKGSVSASSINNNHNQATNINAVAGIPLYFNNNHYNSFVWVHPMSHFHQSVVNRRFTPFFKARQEIKPLSRISHLF